MLSLLYASIFGILFILSLLAGFALSQNEGGTASAASLAPSATTLVPAPESPAFKLGRKVWNVSACASCHNKNMKDDSVGPALSGVTNRWAAYPREDLYAWIRNSQALVSAKHPRAIEVWKENKKQVMTNYSNLTDEELEGLLAFIEER
jgi:cytochrome c2